MAITTSFSDNQDGTGGVVTVSGSVSGSTNSLWISPYMASANRNFVFANSRVGDGTIPLSFGDTGPVAYMVVNQNGPTVTFTTPVSVLVTNEADSLHWRFMQAVRQHVIGLALPDVTNDPSMHFVLKMGVQISQAVKEFESNTNCVLYIPSAFKPTPADNERDTWDMPVSVIFIRRGGQSIITGLKEVMGMRERVFRNQNRVPFADVPDVYEYRILGGPIVDQSNFAQGLDVSLLQFFGKAEVAIGLE